MKHGKLGSSIAILLLPVVLLAGLALMWGHRSKINLRVSRLDVFAMALMRLQPRDYVAAFFVLAFLWLVVLALTLYMRFAIDRVPLPFDRDDQA